MQAPYESGFFNDPTFSKATHISMPCFTLGTHFHSREPKNGKLRWQDIDIECRVSTLQLSPRSLV